MNTTHTSRSWRAGVLLAIACPLTLVADDPPKKAADADRVLRALVHLRTAAETNARDPLAKKAGDSLADFYIRDLAGFCFKEKIPVNEYLIALGVGLDPSDYLRSHPLTRIAFKNLGSDEERNRRRASLGEPTLRKRPDWLLHFALSAALTANINPETAELLGIAKELQDALGPSGFSFADLAADDAGIAFAKNLLAQPDRLADVAQSFRGDQFLPAIGDLEEGLNMKALTQKYGEPSSEKFSAATEAIRNRMNGQDVYKKWTEKVQKSGANE